MLNSSRATRECIAQAPALCQVRTGSNHLVSEHGTARCCDQAPEASIRPDGQEWQEVATSLHGWYAARNDRRVTRCPSVDLPHEVRTRAREPKTRSRRYSSWSLGRAARRSSKPMALWTGSEH